MVLLPGLYAVDVEGGSVAGHVLITDEYVAWVMPGGRQRAYDIGTLLPPCEGVAFAFIDRQGRSWELRPLTPELFNTECRLPGQPSYRTQRELRAAFELSLG